MHDEIINPPPLEIMDRLHAELTRDLIHRVAKFARRRVYLTRRAGAPSDKNIEREAEAIATEAATLTVLGQRVWNPDVDLFTHLCGVVRSITSIEMKNQKKAPKRTLKALSMDDSNDGIAKFEAELATHGPISSSLPRHAISLTDASNRLLQALRVLAHRDGEVSRLLDAYEEGIDDPIEARKAAGLSREEYRNARRRLDRMIDAIPDNTNDEGAFDALEVSYGY